MVATAAAAATQGSPPIPVSRVNRPCPPRSSLEIRSAPCLIHGWRRIPVVSSSDSSSVPHPNSRPEEWRVP